MMDQTCGRILEEILRRESFSLLAHAEVAQFWTPYHYHLAHSKLQGMISQEKEIRDALFQILARQKISTSPFGTFPADFSGLNYMALEKILPRLIDCQNLSITDLEKAIPDFPAGPVKSLLEKRLLLRREHRVCLNRLFSKS